MDREVLEKYKNAGRIAAFVKEELLKACRPGVKILTLAEKGEELIKEKGAQLAFPINISINEIAAHYTPAVNDERRIQEGELVKIDIGVHVDGYIGDTAFTYCSEKNSLVSGAKNALEAGISVIKPSVGIQEISLAIEGAVKELGLGVIVNLTGHTLDRYVFHGSPSIPNVKNESGWKFREGDVIALEPFVTESNGFVKDSSTIEIYRYLADKPVRLAEARKILTLAKEQFHELPFAKRWLYQHFSPVKISLALRQLENVGALETYPVLKETEGKRIAQAEHTIIVADPPVVTTKMG